MSHNVLCEMSAEDFFKLRRPARHASQLAGKAGGEKILRIPGVEDGFRVLVKIRVFFGDARSEVL